MKTTAPLSQSQYGIYAECVQQAGKACYNIPYLYTLDGSLDGQLLCQAIVTAFKAHPTLFTRITLSDDGEPLQTIDMENEELALDVDKITDIEKEKQHLVQPFNIYGDRLFRVRLMSDGSKYYYFADFHHIIVDGTSQQLLLADIDRAYNGQPIAPEELTMAEVATAEAATRQGEAFEADKQWYAQTFDCGDTFTQLLPDVEGGSRQGSSQLRTLNVDMAAVDDFCKRNGVYRSNFFTMAYAFLLAKYAGEHEALFTTVINGRTDKRFLHSVGMTVKTLPVYAKFTADTTVMEFLKAGQEQMSGCRNHGTYTWSDVVSDLALQTNSMFGWHGMIFSDDQLCGKPMKAERVVTSTLTASLYIKAFILGGHYQVKAEYNANEYSEALISQFLESYEAVVTDFLTQQYLRDVSIATPAQTAMLDEFNQTDVDYDSTQTIVSLFSRQAQATPKSIAVVYNSRSYTYAQVDTLSSSLAARIAAQGLGGGDVVSVLIPRCEWMAIASLAVLKAGCAYQPLDPSYPQERLNFMMKDASAKLLIADESLRPLVNEYQGPVITLAEAAQPSDSSSFDGVKATPTPDSLFILLYTSGSTGVPKGCQLTHANLVAFCHWYQRFYELKPGDNVAAYASYGFDASMMDLYPALTCGATVHIIAEDIRLDLIALNDYFERNAISHSFMTTQVGYQFATTIENHSLRYLSTGGEKLASLTPPTGYKLYNVYGPTECTIFTTVYQVTSKLNDIPIGKPLDNMRLYVVDAQGNRLPVGAAGELWVSGPQVSRGYLNRPEKTAEVYTANPFTTNAKYSRIYRTGDIVRFLPSGDIQFVGRRDGQVKIRGFRIELKEVESILREYPGITDVTVQAFNEDNGSGKFVAAYIVGPKPIDIEALNNFILEQKPPYMVPAVTMQIDAIPLNQNQKVNKRALPKPVRTVAEPQQATNQPLNVLEQELHDMVADIVGSTDFSVTTPLGYAGLTSISAIRLAVQVHKRFAVDLDSKSLVKSGTLQSIENEILARLLAAPSATSTSISTTSGQVAPDGKIAGHSGSQSGQRRSAPLTYAQTGVYFDCLKNPTSTIYNIPYLLTFPATTDASQLSAAVAAVAASHPELSVSFSTQGDTIVQSVAEDLAIDVPIRQMTDSELTELKTEFVQPFNLQKAPLCRFLVAVTPSAVHLLFDVHHLAFDGGSADLFIRQVLDQMETPGTIQPEAYTYLDFAADQQQAETTDAFRQAHDYFAEQLQCCEGASEIPADLKSTEQGFIGQAVSAIDHAAVADFCRKHDITPAHLFYAATAYVVARYTNNRDVYLCTVSSGRSNLKIADTVGMFVNTLALALNVDDVTVEQFLNKAANSFDTTLRHENYPFARIAADYGFRPAIAYAYQVGVLSEYKLHDTPVPMELLELNVPKFKINIKVEDRGLVVQYDDALYTQATADALAQSIVTVAQNIMASPGSRVRQLSIVSPEQAAQLQTLRYGDTAQAPFSLFHESLAHYATSQPDQQALVACDATFTYAELNEAANRVAAALAQHGVSRGDRIAMLLPRTSRLIITMFGIMKAGAAYIPCDPDYPADRVSLILDDSEARLIVTTADRLATVPADKAIDVETLLEPVEQTAPNATVPGGFAAGNASATPDDLAYIIYTSGSTGRPKGVMLRHEGICNYLYGHPANVFANAVLTDATRILSVTTISFDAALQDIGTAIYSGKTLILATEEQANNPIALSTLIREQHIDMVSGTPSRWLTWLTSPDFCQAIAAIHIARAGGEKFSDQLLQQLRQATKARIFNCYGPTEITVASNNKELTHATRVTVGRPQLNVREFIVDTDGNELPVGVVGELYIGGRGVARGYNNLDQMTKERFINYHGERIYKSGDYAKWLPDGDVVILGRTDHQIKLRGLRIELGEIENVMLRVEGMKKVEILIRQIAGKEHLCAYYTADHTIAADALKAEISRSLTQYMVPTAYLQLQEMPLTPNGKTNVKALPEPQLAVTAAYEEPATDGERTFCQIFADILQMERVGATDNFFELGGTSLVVTRVIIEADKAGLHVAYGDVFANPTPRQLAALVDQAATAATVPGSFAAGEAPTTATTTGPDGFDYGPIDRLLATNNLATFRQGQSQQLGNVLVTGATGYLGIHILNELLSSDAQNIYCLVRAKSQDKGESRLRTLLFYYFANAHRNLFGKRLHVVLGDVTQDLVPLLANHSIDTVFNCAAVVKHFAEGTEIEDVNIGGARRCADYCLATGARLVHISTASTRGLWVGTQAEAQQSGAMPAIFTEQRLYMGQYLGNKYIYSKFMAERLLLDAVAHHGLKAKIMRVGNLAARSTDGEFQANFSTNAFMGRIRVYNMLGCCPYNLCNKPVEFSPINEVARAIVLLSTTPDGCTVFHPYNIHTQFLGDVLTGLSSVGQTIRFVEQEQFQQALAQAADDPQQARQLSSLLAYQDMAHGQKTADVTRDNNYTTQLLYRLGFSWSPTSWDYVERMLTAIGGFGFFE